MKQAAKIFIIIGMVCQFWLIFPIIVGMMALKKIDTAQSKSELTGTAIATLILCNMIGGILMLCINEKEFPAGQQQQMQYGQPQYGQPQYGQPQYGQPQYGQPQYAQPQQQYYQPPQPQQPPVDDQNTPNQQ